jgi:peptide chain release factor 1
MTQKNTTKTPTFSATKKDFNVDWFSGQGAGGQKRNKTQNCCRITHLPSGLMAVSQEHRTRPANQRDAFNRLAAKIIEHYKLNEGPEREISTETIRTYHEPRNIVKDHASGFTQEYRYVVKDGNIADMLEARRREMGAE